MPLQYIQDDNGMTTAVVVPIDEWNRITEKYADVEQIPEWQKKIIDQRITQDVTRAATPPNSPTPCAAT